LSISPEVARVRTVIRKRLMDEPRIKAGEKALDSMLVTLARGGFVTLEPEPPREEPAAASESVPSTEVNAYIPQMAHPTPELEKLLVFRSIHPLYGAFLLQHLGLADRDERIQALESVLEIPRALLRHIRVPPPEVLPPGPLAKNRLDEELIRRGLMVAPVDDAAAEDDADDDWRAEEERPPNLADKLRLLFEARYPEVADVHTQSVWAAGELLRFGGNFNKFVQARDLVKQEGIVFRHLLRLILLCGEFAQVCPADVTPEAWQLEMRDIADQLTASCREVDPASTDEIIERAHAADVVEGETPPPAPPPV